MRLCAAARALTVISIGLMVGYAYEVGVWGPYWPAWPHSWRTVGELGIMACAPSLPLFRPVSRRSALI